MNDLFFLLLAIGKTMASIHPGFISLSDVCSDFKLEINYSTPDNFTGEVVSGYKSKKAYFAVSTAYALCEVQKEASKRGLGLKIFDAYRPVKAVSFFQDWAKLPETNAQNKQRFYPKYSRLELFEKGFISKSSSHSRGSAVDLTLFNLKTGADLDMGSEFDYFDDISKTDSKEISPVQFKNRMELKELMESKGFKNFSQEWWHYSLIAEPYPGTAFDFDVE